MYDVGTDTWTKSALRLDTELMDDHGTYNLEATPGYFADRECVCMGCTQGAGLSIAIELAEAGCHVVVNGRSPEHWEMSQRMMRMTRAEADAHCGASVEAVTTIPQDYSELYKDKARTTKLAVNVIDFLSFQLEPDTTTTYYKLPQRCDPSYTQRIDVPEAVVARMRYEQGDVRRYADVRRIMATTSARPAVIVNLASFINAGSSPVLSAASNRRIRNYFYKGTEINDVTEESIHDTDAIIAALPDFTTGVLAPDGDRYDDLFLTTVKGQAHMADAMQEVWGGYDAFQGWNRSFVMIGGESSTQVGTGFFLPHPVFRYGDLSVYHIGKKSMESMLRGFTFRNMLVASILAPGMKTSKAYSRFLYLFGFGSRHLSGDKAVEFSHVQNMQPATTTVYAYDAQGDLVAFDASNNHRRQLLTMWHFLAWPTVQGQEAHNVFPPSQLYAKQHVRAAEDALREQRTVTRLPMFLSSDFDLQHRVCANATHHAHCYSPAGYNTDYETGIEHDLLGTERRDAFLRASSTAVFNDEQLAAWHVAALRVSGGQNTGIFRREVVVRKTIVA
jgi:NAD(P)-dependent dehydrogenase (short-subunit alcohol dehydrogenase family)